MITKEMKKHDIKDIKEQHFKAREIIANADEKEMQQIKLSVSDRSFDIVCKFHGIDGESHSMISIAKEYGLTSERINQIIRKTELTIISLHENILDEDKIAYDNLSKRSKNALFRYLEWNYNIAPESIKDICILSESEIRKIRNIGESSIEEIKNAVKSRGYEFKKPAHTELDNYVKSFNFSVENLILRELKCNNILTIKDLRKTSEDKLRKILHNNDLFVEIALYIANIQMNYFEDDKK